MMPANMIHTAGREAYGQQTKSIALIKFNFGCLNINIQLNQPILII